MIFKRSARKGIAVALVASAALVAYVAPAGADVSDTTQMSGGVTTDGEAWYIDPTGSAIPTCVGVNGKVAHLYNTGTFNGSTTSFETTTIFVTRDTFWVIPGGGIFGDPLCLLPTVVKGTLKVWLNGVGACHNGAPDKAGVPATYQETGAVAAAYALETTEDITCELPGTPTTSGKLSFNGVFVEPSTDRYVGTYTQTRL